MKKMFMLIAAISTIIFLVACGDSAPNLKEIDNDLKELKASFTLDFDTSNVTTNITLPTSTTVKTGEVKIIWESDSPTYINNTGEVLMRPTPSEGDKTVILTATFDHLEVNNETQYNKQFTITLLSRELTDQERVEDAINKYSSLSYVNPAPLNPEMIFNNIEIKSVGANDVEIAWEIVNNPTATVNGQPNAELLVDVSEEEYIEVFRPDFGQREVLGCETSLEYTDGAGEIVTKTFGCAAASIKATFTYGDATAQEKTFEIKILELPEDVQQGVEDLALLIKGWVIIPAVGYNETAPRQKNGYNCTSDRNAGATCYVGDYINLPGDYLGIGATLDWDATNPDNIVVNEERTMMEFIRPEVGEDEINTIVKVTITATGAQESATTSIPVVIVPKQKMITEQISDAKNSFDNFPAAINEGEINQIVPNYGNVDISWGITTEGEEHRLSTDGTVYRPVGNDLNVTIQARFTTSVCELFEQRDPSNNNEYVLNPYNLTRPRTNTSCKTDWDEKINSGWPNGVPQTLKPMTIGTANIADTATNNEFIKVEKNEYGNAMRYYVEFDGQRYDIKIENTYNTLKNAEESIYYYYQIDVKDFPVTLKDASESTQTTLRTVGGKIYTLNPHQYEYGTEGSVLGYALGSFYTTVPNANFDSYEWVPEMAASDPVMTDTSGLKWQISIKEDLKFYSSGKPITADTYIESYKSLLDPRLKNYRAYIMYDTIKVRNAKEYFRGTADGWDSVGVKKIDDYTLEFDLLEPETMESMRTALATFILSPINVDRQKITPLPTPGAKGETHVSTYGTSVENFDGHGSFKLTVWNKQQVRRYQKNPDYSIYKLAETAGYEHLKSNWTHAKESIIEDPNVSLQEFIQGKLDIVNISGENAKNYVCNPDVDDCRQPKQTVGSAVWKLSVNSKNITDLNLKKALYFGIDRDKLTNAEHGAAYPHVGAATVLTDAYYPQAVYGEDGIKGISADSTDSNFVTEAGLGVPYTETIYGKQVKTQLGIDGNKGFSPTEAIEAFNQACTDSYGGSGTIEMGLLTFTSSDSMKATVEWVERFYETLFNDHKDATDSSISYDAPSSNCKLDIKLQYMPANIAYKKMMTFEYDLALNAWSGSAFNPWSALEVYKGDAGTCLTTTDGKCEEFRQKLEPFNNAEFNQILEQVLSSNKSVNEWQTTLGGLKNPSSDEEYKQKMEYLAQLEYLLLKDFDFVPLYATNSFSLYNTRILLPNEEYVPGVGYGTLYSGVSNYDTGKLIPQQ